ncbi:MAG: putative sugar transferase EpsL [Bacteroidetes bacterium ADurb.Bin141]|nr:sugar transferase [Bacteroidota bacterium]MCB8931708.1 sugar transferase [Bacteroidia bacterium]MCE7954695.1 sugar transferase [Bacteroidetes bacterium CHB6]OQB61846.1 MAG: putative sugar transferase EpsL [Bacteroidetes bacterium ADurb.Bin141]MCO5289487.1 sugar transferase [Bacteroidota bacterium]
MIFKGENTETGILNLDDLVDHEEAVEALKAKTESRNERFVSNLIEKYIDTGRSESITFSANSSNTADEVLQLEDNTYTSIIHFRRINTFPYINKFFEAVNSKLPIGGIFVTKVETNDLRKIRLMEKYPPVVNKLYYTSDFFLKRVFPKLPVTQQLYYYFTKGRNRVLSKTEVLGRLYSCGFKILEERYISNRLYIVAEKFREPAFDDDPSYGIVYPMRRVGKGGKIINVYKFRTMYAYSEYLQEYIYEKNSLDTGGKFKDDFRVSRVGKLLRRYWIDELPMIVNVLKGDLKIVGVRPLSRHYLSLYTPELQNLRKKFKPGLIPPYYVDLPETMEEIMDSEMRYLKAYEKHPFLTDVKYFFLVGYTILFKKARSK